MPQTTTPQPKKCESIVCFSTQCDPCPSVRNKHETGPTPSAKGYIFHLKGIHTTLGLTLVRLNPEKISYWEYSLSKTSEIFTRDPDIRDSLHHLLPLCRVRFEFL